MPQGIKCPLSLPGAATLPLNLSGVKALSQGIRWPPTRHQAIWGVIMLASFVGVAGFVTSGIVAGLSLLLGFPGVLSLILLFLPVRPKVVASLRGTKNARTTNDGFGLIIEPEQVIGPLDIDQIVKSEEHAALETMPRTPAPMVPRGAFGGIFDLNASTANMLSEVSGVSDDELRAFMGKAQAFGEELRAWLESLQASRYQRLRGFTAVARVRELGNAPADFARVRLRFPAEFEEWKAPPKVPSPPERPEFVGRYGRVVPRAAAVARIESLSRLIPRPEEFNGTAAEYSREDGKMVIALGIGHINQHDHRDSAEFLLLAASPGVYEVEWQVSADGLSPPSEGRIKVEVREPPPGDPIIQLKDALAERKRHSLD
jgi:hypothetical protein